MVKAQFSQDQAFQILLAAVQAGKIDLPFLREFKSSIKRYPDSPFADVVERDWQNFFKEATGAAKLDAAYLFSFYFRSEITEITEIQNPRPLWHKKKKTCQKIY